MIGDNDFCSEFCYNDFNSILKEHESDLVTALRILKKNLPRTFVNIIPPPSKYLFFFVIPIAIQKYSQIWFQN